MRPFFVTNNENKGATFYFFTVFIWDIDGSETWR